MIPLLSVYFSNSVISFFVFFFVLVGGGVRVKRGDGALDRRWTVHIGRTIEGGERSLESLLLILGGSRVIQNVNGEKEWRGPLAVYRDAVERKKALQARDSPRGCPRV